MLRGEFISLETAKKIHEANESQKNNNQINKNILEANIKLVDENKLLKVDNEILTKRIQNTKELLDFLKKYSSNGSLEVGQIEKIKNTLDGLDG